MADHPGRFGPKPRRCRSGSAYRGACRSRVERTSRPHMSAVEGTRNRVAERSSPRHGTGGAAHWCPGISGALLGPKSRGVVDSPGVILGVEVFGLSNASGI